MILGAQAPGKVGHRQVNKRKGYLLGDGLFCANYDEIPKHRGSTRSIHTAGDCVISRSVA